MTHSNPNAATLCFTQLVTLIRFAPHPAAPLRFAPLKESVGGRSAVTDSDLLLYPSYLIRCRQKPYVTYKIRISKTLSQQHILIKLGIVLKVQIHCQINLLCIQVHIFKSTQAGVMFKFDLIRLSNDVLMWRQNVARERGKDDLVGILFQYLMQSTNASFLLFHSFTLGRNNTSLPKPSCKNGSLELSTHRKLKAINNCKRQC